jgi:transposase InsO family protein
MRFSRRVIGWALGRTLAAGLSALRMALRQRRPPPGLVHHSDRGVQYASQNYTDLLKEHKIQISMSRKGNPLTGLCKRCHFWRSAAMVSESSEPVVGSDRSAWNLLIAEIVRGPVMPSAGPGS